MRTSLFILGGFALWAVMLASARFFGIAQRTALLAFALLWCAVAVANMWMGVARAGYSIREELPICLLVFLLPAGFAFLAEWRVLWPR
ncbi:MAG: hypothetical protein P4L36_03310 [Holophaga sp.]|nr:hypothetical protein [Holophaga sp.]